MAKQNFNLKQWHDTRRGLAVFGVLEVLLAYGVASRALDTGSWWEYALTLVLLYGGLRNLARLAKRLLSK